MAPTIPALVASLTTDSLAALLDDLDQSNAASVTPLGWFHTALTAAAGREYAARRAYLDDPIDLVPYA